MTGATMSIDSLIVGLGFLFLCFAVFEYIKRQWDRNYRNETRVENTMSNIYTNALWEYHNKWEPKQEPKEEDFMEKLENETKTDYFKKREEPNTK